MTHHRPGGLRTHFLWRFFFFAASLLVVTQPLAASWSRIFTSSGTIYSWDNQDDDGNYTGTSGSADDYYFTPPGPGIIKVYTTGWTNTYGNLYVPGSYLGTWWPWLGGGDDGGDYSNFLITYTLSQTAQFNIHIQGSSEWDSGDYQICVDFAPLPIAPVAAAASNLTISGFTANWGSIAAASGYYLEVSPNSSFTTYVSGYQNRSVGNVTSFAVTGLTANTTYYYRLHAVGDGGTTGNSNVITVSTVYSPPPVPTASAATLVTATSFTANWTSASGATSYRFDLSTSSTFATFVTYNDWNAGTVTTLSITGLNPSTTYYYRLRSVGAGGTSASSTAAMVATLPGSPQFNNTIAGLTGTGFGIEWQSVSGATSYRLDVSTVSNFASFVSGYQDLNVGNVTSYTFNGLNPTTTYYYRLRAVGASGTSVNSGVSQVKTLAMFWQRVFTASGTIYNWDNQDEEGNYTGTSASSDSYYFTPPGPGVLKIYTTGSTDTYGSFAYPGWFNGQWWPGLASSDSGGENDYNFLITYTVPPSPPSGQFYLEVHGQDEFVSGDYQIFADFSPRPAAPTVAAATSVTISSLTANWSAVTSATGYALDVATNSGFTSYVSGYQNRSVGKVTTFAVSGLLPNATYYYRVRTLADGGTSDNSGTTTVATVYSPPPVPAQPTPTAISSSGFTANWVAVSGATSYRLDFSTVGSFATFLTYSDWNAGTATSVAITGLTPNTGYYYRVRSVGPGGTSASSPTGVMMTLPGTPSFNTTISGLNGNGFGISWASVSGAMSYRLDVSTVSNFATFLAGYQNLNVGSGTSYTFTGLSPTTTYYYRLRTEGLGGTSATSGTGQATTLRASWTLLYAASGTIYNNDNYDDDGNYTGTSGSWDPHYFTIPGAGTLKIYTTGTTDTAADFSFPGWSSTGPIDDGGAGDNFLLTTFVGQAGGTTLWVHGHDEFATGDYQVCAEFSPQPSSPVGADANAVSTTGFSVSWTPVSGIVGYYLDIATDSDFSHFVTGFHNLNVGNVTSFTASGLTAGTTYYYRVRAANDGGPSASSAAIAVTTAADPESLFGWHEIHRGAPTGAETQAASRSGQLRAMIAAPNASNQMVAASYSSLDFSPTPDLQSIADALNHDPLRIYEWVRNTIDFVPYNGLQRGPQMTAMEKAGNDFDQAALLAVLLRASGIPAANVKYKFANVFIPLTEASTWLGMDSSQVVPFLTHCGAGYIFPNPNHTGGNPDDNLGYWPILSTDTLKVRVPHVWVDLMIGTTHYTLDPSFKTYSTTPAVSLTAASTYTRADLMNTAGGTVSGTGYTMPATGATGLAAVRTKLNTYTNQLLAWAKTTRPTASGWDLAGGRAIIPQIFPAGTALPSDLPSTWSIDGTPETWSDVPTLYATTLDLTVGGVTWNTYAANLKGKKIGIWFKGISGQTVVNAVGITLDDVVQVKESAAGTGDAGVTIVYGFPDFRRNVTQNATPLPRAGSYVLAYGYGHTVGRLQQRLKMQASYVSQALSAQGMQLLTENLNIMGLQHLSQADALARVADGVANCYCTEQLVMGIVGVTPAPYNAPFIDLPIGLAFTWPRYATTGLSDKGLSVKMFRLSAYWGSMMEHLTIQETAGVAGVSTVRMLQKAVENGDAVYLVKTTAEYNALVNATPQKLFNYPGPGLNATEKQNIAAFVTAGGEVMLPANQSMTYGSYTGTGYLEQFAHWDAAAKDLKAVTYAKISNGYAGGFSTVTNDLSATSFYDAYAANPSTTSATAPGLPRQTVGEPVDASNGAFYTQDTDLTLGGEAPHGLALMRAYSVARQYSNPVLLGKGWTHSYDIRINDRSPTDFDPYRASVAEIAPLIVALKAMYDADNFDVTTITDSSNAKEWLVPAVIACWVGDQWINTRADVTIGDSSMEFVRLPDGTYAAPGNFAGTLTVTPGAVRTLQVRKGNKLTFLPSGQVSQITDSNNSTSTARSTGFTYKTVGTASVVDRVTDSFGRYLVFTYNAGKLTGVSDSTGRSVVYGTETVGGRTAFAFTDAAGKKSWLIYETGTNRIAELRDALSRTTVSTLFDLQDRAVYQKTFGQDARTWTYGYAPGVTHTIDPAGKHAWYYFDVKGRKTAFVDEGGKKHTWTYDGADRITSITTPLGETNSLAYNSNNEVISITNAAGNTRAITPESDDSVTSGRTENNFEGQSIGTTYYAYHKPNTITNPGNIQAQYQYEARGRVWKAHPAAYSTGSWIVYTYEDTAGSPSYTKRVTATYPDAGSTTEISDFDARGNLIQFIDRRGKKSTFAYNGRRQTTSVVAWTGSYNSSSPVGGTPPAGSATTTTDYDDSGNIDYIIDPNGNKTSYSYDALGHLSTMTGPDLVVQVRNTFDSRNLVESTSNAVLGTSHYQYDALSRTSAMADPLGRLTQFGYDDDGRQNNVQTALGFPTSETYDAIGTKHTTTDAKSNSVTYGYDKDGRLTSLQNRRQKTFGIAYDDTARTKISSTPLGKNTTETRNSRGLVTSTLKSSGAMMEFTAFDTEGRPTTEVISRAGGSIEATLTMGYFPGGLLNTVTEVGGSNTKTTTRTYDDFGRLQSYDDGEGNTIGYRYDATGNLKKLIYPDAKEVNYTYDSYNRLKTVADWTLLTARLTNYSYDAAGRLTRVDRPNGTWRQLAYDAAGQVFQVEERTSSGALIWRRAVAPDPDGRITTTMTFPVPQSYTVPVDSATYDDDNRLLTWTPAGGGAVSPVHDEDGNMTWGPTLAGGMGAYSFDVRNRLTSAASVSYTYNADNLRTGAGSVSYVVDPNATLSRVLVRRQGSIVTRYVWGLGLLYDETENGGSTVTQTYHYNEQGSTVALTDSTGLNVTDKIEYSSFGMVSYRTGTSDSPFLLHGSLGVMTDTSGLVYMRARYYNARAMRFVNADPIGFGGGTNWYAFGDNNPISVTDPFGLCGSPSDAGGTDWNRLAQRAVGILMAIGGAEQNNFREKLGLPPVEQSNVAKWIDGAFESLTLDDHLMLMAVGTNRTPVVAVENSMVRVGRWMSQAEADAMAASGRVQAPLNGAGATHVTVPPNPQAFTPPSGSSVFVEFDVPASQLRVHDTTQGWGRIFGPTSLEARLAARKNLPVPTEMPPATKQTPTASARPRR